MGRAGQAHEIITMLNNNDVLISTPVKVCLGNYYAFIKAR